MGITLQKVPVVIVEGLHQTSSSTENTFQPVTVFETFIRDIHSILVLARYKDRM
jgi:hypothetical protein